MLSQTVKEVRQPQDLAAIVGDADVAGGGGPCGDPVGHSSLEARVHALVVVHGVPVAARMKGIDISRVEEGIDGDRMVGVGGSIRIGRRSRDGRRALWVGVLSRGRRCAVALSEAVRT